MQRLIRRNKQHIDKIEKEFRQLISALSLEVHNLSAKVADLTDVGDDVPESRVRQARLPARPTLMVNAGVGSDAKGG